MSKHSASDSAHDGSSTYPRSRDVVNASKSTEKLKAEGKVEKDSGMSKENPK